MTLRLERVLFILKRRQDYDGYKHSQIGLSTGLYNSALYMSDMLNNNKIESKVVVVVDNNCIDKEVHLFKPTHVIIEALWVVPEKFEILHKLHPNVKWIIRLHSQIPFISNEGNAMRWIGEYVTRPNVYIGVNAIEMTKDMRIYLKSKMKWTKGEENSRIIYLPNYYPQKYVTKKLNKERSYINVSCFGSIRPLKNHLIQAIAAIKFADKIGKKLHFHINGDRVEQKGQPVLSNLIGLFDELSDKGHLLIQHDWTPREEFLELCSEMDLGMQVSFSETFNIVGADLISKGVPLVGSDEIPWLSSIYCAKPTMSEDISEKLLCSYKFPKLNVWLNQRNLNCYSNETIKTWVKALIRTY